MNPDAEKEFQDSFDKLIEGASDVIVIHSALWSFAHQFGREARSVPPYIISLLREVAGPARTLVFPSYSFSFCSTHTYDVVQTPSETGVLSATALAEPEALRTLQPVFSNVALGPRAHELVGRTAVTAWGGGSAMEWFAAVDARYVVMGVPWHFSASIIHSSEERKRVPYRYFKSFPGAMTRNGKYVSRVREILFVRSLAVPPDFDYEPVSQALHVTADCRCSLSERFPMESASARTIVAEADRLLTEDPYIFTRNRDAVAAWVRDGKATEMAALADDARPPRELA